MGTYFEMLSTQARPIPGALANFGHPLVQAKVQDLSTGCATDRESFLAFVDFIRDEIPFGFNRHFTLATASEVLEEKIGCCNTKTTLLAAMCRAVGIPVRVHFGQMNSAILNGLVWGLPPTVAHAYAEVELEGRWRPVDSYIVDRAMCNASLQALGKKNIRLGFGLAIDSAPFSVETCIDGDGFIQMGGLVGDYGLYDDVIEFVQTPYCKPVDLNNKGFGGMMYQLFYRSFNRKIDRFRRLG